MKTRYVFIIIISVLIASRIALPYLVLWYATTEINKRPNYHVKIADLNFHLLEGKVTVVNAKLWKKDIDSKDPIFTVKHLSFSLQWRELFKGKLAVKIRANRPVITIVDISEDQKRKEKIPQNKNINKNFKSFAPPNIIQITVDNGAIYYKKEQIEHPFTIYLKKMNVNYHYRGSDSTFDLTARAMDSGDLSVNGKFNPLVKTPTFYIKLSIKELSLPKINDFLKQYTDVKTKTGSFSLFLEVAGAHQKITGYAKPFVKNLKIEEEKNAGLGQKVYEGAISLANNILKNVDKKSTATKIKFSGDIDDPDISIFSLIGYFIRHGFIEALLPSVDNSLSMHDIIYGQNK